MNIGQNAGACGPDHRGTRADMGQIIDWKLSLVVSPE